MVMEIICQMTWGNVILYYYVAIYEFVEANAVWQFTSTCLYFKFSHFGVSLFKFLKFLRLIIYKLTSNFSRHYLYSF